MNKNQLAKQFKNDFDNLSYEDQEWLFYYLFEKVFGFEFFNDILRKIADKTLIVTNNNLIKYFWETIKEYKL